MKKRYSLFLSLLLILSILCTGCTKTTDNENPDNSLVEEHSAGSKEPSDDSTEASLGTTTSLFDFSLYDSSTVFSKEDIAVQESFETFLKELFMEAYQSSTITVNFLLEHPENYGLEPLASSWPASDDASIEHYDSEVDAYVQKLNSFSYDALTYEQKLIYDTLKIHFENEYDYDDIYLFESPFSVDGITSQLPLIFTEYTFQSKTDVEEYLNLLNTLKDYISEQFKFEEKRISKGYYLSSYTYETVVEQCKSFLNQGENYLSDIFADKLANTDFLSEEEKAAFIQSNKDAIKNSVIPAYESMIATLPKLQEKGTCEAGLSQIEHGLDYYNYLLKNNVGTSKTPEELISLVEKNIVSYITELQKLILKDETLLDKLENHEYLYSDPKEILAHFEESIEQDFPKAVSNHYELKDIDEAMADDLSIAFYILSPLDNFENNIIYLNQEHIANGSDLFPTLAHEGIPGHMYQHNYFCSLNPHYFRTILNFTGYSEAWAEYVELYSYNWSGMDKTLQAALKINQLYSCAIPTRIDLGVNYEGWTVSDVKAYLNMLGLDGEEFAQTYYDTAISCPGVFFTYYIGYLELMEIQETIQNTLGNQYCVKDFHKYFLEIGPTYFDVIDSRIAEWAERIQSQD